MDCMVLYGTFTHEASREVIRTRHVERTDNNAREGSRFDKTKKARKKREGSFWRERKTEG